MMDKTGGKMKLTHTKLWLIIIFTVVSLTGIVVIQFIWIDNAIKLEEATFNKQIEGYLADISQAIGRDCELYTSLRNAVASACNPSVAGPSESRMQEMTGAVQSIIDSVFAANNFLMDYEFGLMPLTEDPDNRQLLAVSNDDADPSLFIHSTHIDYSVLDRAGAISLYFPGERTYLARQILYLLILSVLFILMVTACFGYVIFTINRQKKLSEMKNDFINNLTHEFKTPIFLSHWHPAC